MRDRNRTNRMLSTQKLKKHIDNNRHKTNMKWINDSTQSSRVTNMEIYVYMCVLVAKRDTCYRCVQMMWMYICMSHVDRENKKQSLPDLNVLGSYCLLLIFCVRLANWSVVVVVVVVVCDCCAHCWSRSPARDRSSGCTSTETHIHTTTCNGRTRRWRIIPITCHSTATATATATGAHHITTENISHTTTNNTSTQQHMTRYIEHQHSPKHSARSWPLCALCVAPCVLPRSMIVILVIQCMKMNWFTELSVLVWVLLLVLVLLVLLMLLFL